LGNEGKIYAIGGFGGKSNEPLNSVEMFDPKTNKWTYVAPMKYARRALSAAFLLDGIYAIGGFNGEHYMSSVEKFEESVGKWE
jgi:N-acetylneuraminic acid mutarotase